MPQLDFMSADVLSYMLNYTLVGLTNITAEYLFLRTVFPMRRSPALWYVYFVIKYVVDAYLWCEMGGGVDAASLGLTFAIWSFVSAVLSFVVVYRSFESDMVSVGSCAVTCDLFGGIVTLASATASNVMWGLPLESGYLRPFGLPVVCECMIAAALYAAISSPVSWLLRMFCRMMRRNRVVWGVAAVCLIAIFVTTTQGVAFSSALENDLPHSRVVPLMSVLVLAFSAPLLLRARENRRREQVVRECAKLASSYDRAVKAQLEEVERDLIALDGHEHVLDALDSRDADVDLRISDLRRAYVHLSEGAYCNRPALDAVLMAEAQRLRGLGANPAFTVAAVPARSVIPATVCLALLNLACEAAERTDGIEGEAVELRVRGVGDQVLFRLEVPSRWGALWARRFLSAFDTHGTGLVRERKHGDRRVVLVMCEGMVS